MNDFAPIIIAIIAAVPGIAGLVVATHKNEISRAEFVQDAAIDLIEPLKKRLSEQEEQIHLLEVQLRDVIAENALLRARVKKLEAENIRLTADLEGRTNAA